MNSGNFDNFFVQLNDSFPVLPSLESGQHSDAPASVFAQSAEDTPPPPHPQENDVPSSGTLSILDAHGQTLFSDLNALKSSLKSRFSEEKTESELVASAHEILDRWNPSIACGCKITNIAILAAGITFNALKDALEHGKFGECIKKHFPQYSKSTICNYRDYAAIPKVEEYLHVPYTHLLLIHSIAKGLLANSSDPVRELLSKLGTKDAADLPIDKEEITRLFGEAVFTQKLEEKGVSISDDSIERLVNAGMANDATIAKLITSSDPETTVAEILSMSGDKNRKAVSGAQHGKCTQKLTVETSISRLKARLEKEIQQNVLSYSDTEGFKAFLDKANTYYEKMKSKLTPPTKGGE